VKRLVKWLLIILLVIGVLIAGALLYFRLQVGALNSPMGGGSLDAAALESRIRLPDGFTLGLFAADIAGARLLRFTRAGDLLVSIPGEGKILLLEADRNQDGKADGLRKVIDSLAGPNGMDFYADYLYIAETDAIGRVPFDHDLGRVSGDYERIVTGLPGGGNHWKKTLRFGPDGLMYASMGSSCNVCIEADERRAAMVRYQPDGSGEEIYARGLRNSAGFDWSPRDGEIYATDNGRDSLGDDFPPCELNRVQKGQHYGWPFANGDRVPDPDFGAGNEQQVAASSPPVHGFRAHNAPLGIEFIRGTAFPEDYRGAAIVALHGSWNRSEKDGYKLVSLHWNAAGEVEERDFVTGFELDEDVIGRPAEVAEGPDGAIYFSDDYSGAIYRVAYGEPQSLAIPVLDLNRKLNMKQYDNRYEKAETLAAYTDEQRERLARVGGNIFVQDKCMQCHAPNVDGSKSLADLGARYDVRDMMQFLAKPTSPMPVYPYTDDDRRALAVYLISSY
jgi:glucose/arabinose dehydrogenase